MKKLFIFILIFCNVMPLYANEKNSVYVRIEGYDKTIAKGYVTGAYTFIDAVSKLCALNDIEIITKQGKTERNIYAVDNVKEKTFGEADGWNGFIVRNNNVIQPVNILSEYVFNGDEAVLYYGVFETKKVGRLDCEALDNRLVFKAAAIYTQWVSESGIWTPGIINENIQGVKVHLKTPDNSEQIAVTNMDGTVDFYVSKPGKYFFYGEGYLYTDSPFMVKTDEVGFLYKIKNDEVLSRGEFLSLTVNYAGLINSGGDFQFSDVSEKDILYEDIHTAVSNRLANGHPDGTFKPDSDIKLYEALCILSRLYKNYVTPGEMTVFEGVPPWAGEYVDFALKIGILNGIEKKYNENISLDTAVKLLENVMKSMPEA